MLQTEITCSLTDHRWLYVNIFAPFLTFCSTCVFLSIKNFFNCICLWSSSSGLWTPHQCLTLGHALGHDLVLASRQHSLPGLQCWAALGVVPACAFSPFSACGSLTHVDVCGSEVEPQPGVSLSAGRALHPPLLCLSAVLSISGPRTWVSVLLVAHLGFICQ